VPWDEGVAAPNGDEFTVLARPRQSLPLGRSVYDLFRFRGQYEVRVDRWPRKLLRSPAWRVVVSGQDAERLVGELLELIEAGRWRPGDGEPPVSYSPR